MFDIPGRNLLTYVTYFFGFPQEFLCTTDLTPPLVLPYIHIDSVIPILSLSLSQLWGEEDDSRLCVFLCKCQYILREVSVNICL